MKKKLLTAITICLMSVSAMAVDGTIGTVKVIEDGTMRISVGSSAVYPVVGTTPEAIKILQATILTAKTSGGVVTANLKIVNEVKGWGVIILR